MIIIIIIKITIGFPAHDELGMCGTSLVSPKQSEDLARKIACNMMRLC